MKAPMRKLRRALAWQIRVLLCWWLLLATIACEAADDYPDGSRYLRLTQAQDDRRISIETSYPVVLFLALKYLNDTVALELERSVTPNAQMTNEVASHFCHAVNTQAGGIQVKLHAEALSIDVQTRVVATESGPFYECSILQVNRNYDTDGDDVLPQGLFILQIAVQQQVYTNTTLALDEVTKIVTKGFDRGGGGRVKFRNFLRKHEAFDTVLDVDVLDGSLSAPQAAPSVPPTVAPSFWPSEEPSELPSASPSGVPTLVPSSTPTTVPSSAPSVVPSDFPSQNPSRYPSPFPSESPTTEPLIPLKPSIPSGSNQSSKKADRQPLIVGAIAGGVATILVSCFFVFCVLYPFCMRNKDEDESNRPRSGSSQNSSDEPAGAPVPDMLTLDDDSRSLANTTVTLGDKSLGFRTSSATKPNLETIQMDSFDESSIYTSTFPSSVTGSDLYYNPASPQVAESIAEGIGMVPEVSNEEDATARDSDLDSVLGVRETASDGSPNEEEEGEEDKIKSNRVITKGFDPFADDDEESFSMDSIELSDPSFGTPPNLADEFSPSSTSTKTRRTGNQGKQATIPEHKPEAGDSYLKHRPHSTYTGTSSAMNNTLLRNILEDARRMVQKSGSRSRTSFQSAPSRLHVAEDKKPSQPRSKPKLSDVLAEGRAMREELTRSSSQSVGATPKTGNGSQRLASPLQVNPRPPLHSYRSPFSKRVDRNEDDSMVSPSSSDVGSQLGKDTLGARSIETLMEQAAIDETPSIAVASPPSIRARGPADKTSLGSKEEPSPWLFDTNEPTLGARRRVGPSNSDASPIRSVSSAGSLGSSGRRTGQSSIDELFEKQPIVPRRSSTISLADGSWPDESKEDLLVKPRSLDQELKRIERNVSDPSDNRASYASTSSAGGSRSTMSSSRVHAKSGNVRRVVVIAPPGKLGVVLANHYDGNGTVVSEVRPSSTMKGMLSPGDKLVAVDGHDVTEMVVSKITALMAARARKERKLTVLTTTLPGASNQQETKQDGSP